MRRNYLTNAGDLTGSLASPHYRGCADVLVRDVAWEEPVTGFVYPPPGPQDLQLRGEHYVSILLAFPLVDADDHPLAINVAGFQTYCLRDAQTSRVASRQNCAVFGAVDAAEELQDLLRAQHHW